MIEKDKNLLPNEDYEYMYSEITPPNPANEPIRGFFDYYAYCLSLGAAVIFPSDLSTLPIRKGEK